MAFTSKSQIFPFGMFPDPATQQADVYKQVAPGFQDSPLVNQFLGTATSRPQMGPPRPQMGPPVPTTTPEAKDRSGLAYMLIALGGALRGDKNFIQNTMAIKDAQTEKERREAQKKRYEEVLAELDPNTPKYELYKSLGAEGLDKAAAASYQAEMAASKKGLPTDQENYALARAQGYTGTFMEFLKEKKAPLVTIDQGQRYFEQEGAKAGFKTIQEAQTQIEQYSDIENRLDILAKQLEGSDPLQTGVIEEIKIPFKRLAAGLNILPQEELDKLSQQELFLATTNYIIPRMRVAGSGSTSDKEIDLFKSAVPNLGNTVEGNKVLVGGLRSIAKYNKERLFLMDKYLKNNTNLLGFGEFADKELGPLYETYATDQEFDQKVRNKQIKAGDFVYDAINKQFRVIDKEDIIGATP